MRRGKTGLCLAALGLLCSAEVANAKIDFVQANLNLLSTDQVEISQSTHSEQIEQLEVRSVVVSFL